MPPLVEPSPEEYARAIGGREISCLRAFSGPHQLVLSIDDDF
ncbi:hypothetical protein MMUC44124_03015 [Mycolicibacterium mucogenicum DSM 44124]|nr:hypothetical protein MMUC44124_03015 [Mycolicibacterium mucogenicum DSM 44124]